MGFSATDEDIDFNRRFHNNKKKLREEFGSMGYSMDDVTLKRLRTNPHMIVQPEFQGDVFTCYNKPVTLFPVVVVDLQSGISKGIMLYALVPGDYSKFIPNGNHFSRYSKNGNGKLIGYLSNADFHNLPHLGDVTMVPVKSIVGNTLVMEQDAPPVSGKSFEAAFLMLKIMTDKNIVGINSNVLTGSVKQATKSVLIEPVSTFHVKKIGMESLGLTLYGNSPESPVRIADARQLVGLLPNSTPFTIGYVNNKIGLAGTGVVALAADNDMLDRLSRLVNKLARDPVMTDALITVAGLLSVASKSASPEGKALIANIVEINASTAFTHLENDKKLGTLKKLVLANDKVTNIEAGESVTVKRELDYDYDTIPDFLFGNYANTWNLRKDAAGNVIGENIASYNKNLERFNNRFESYENWVNADESDWIRDKFPNIPDENIIYTNIVDYITTPIPSRDVLQTKITNLVSYPKIPQTFQKKMFVDFVKSKNFKKYVVLKEDYFQEYYEWAGNEAKDKDDPEPGSWIPKSDLLKYVNSNKRWAIDMKGYIEFLLDYSLVVESDIPERKVAKKHTVDLTSFKDRLRDRLGDDDEGKSTTKSAKSVIKEETKPKSTSTASVAPKSSSAKEKSSSREKPTKRVVDMLDDRGIFT